MTMEKGYEILFITPQNRRHEGKLVSKLIIDMAKDHGVQRVTTRIDSEGQGLSGHLHSAHFFELADQPMEIMFVVEEETGDKLIKAIRSAGIHIFCVCKKVTFGNLP
ncbi:DUF190 domain-containing protein [Marinobacter koreensis]|uniref:DUF190 domain-containing protein n=1 Tax=Marinobacter koreensis TaxID=335974 RepID=A0ABW0RIS0_9GAMM|nr:DUF190 domain-containing protein [Marinobacter koreensis]MCK7548397.1 DUF190 domain-containing protein [Marinobacter koreensis]